MKLAVTAIVIEFCVGANFLTWIGVPYVTEGGALPEKINPGTYVLCLAFAAHVASQGRPNWVLWLLFGGDRKLALYFLCLSSCLVYMLLTTGTGNMIVLLDTFIPAGLLACVIRDASEAELQIMLRIFRYGVCANATLALIESAAHATLLPLYLNDVEYHPVDGEFRPIALYDHPLTGSAMTLMGMALAPKTGRFRFMYLALCSAALISFGGRMAVAVGLTSAALIAVVTLLSRVLRRDRAALRLLLCYGSWIIGFGTIASVAMISGAGERLASHLYWDQSAQVRLSQWSLFQDLSFWQVLLGARREDMLALLAPLWLRSGVGVIENFWLLMFVSLGVLGFPIFCTAFFTLLAWCWERTGAHGRVLLAGFLAVVSTSNSLGRKSTLLVALVAAIACLPEWRTRANRKLCLPASSSHAGVLVLADP